MSQPGRILHAIGRFIGYTILVLGTLVLIVAGCTALFAPPTLPGNIPVANVAGTLALDPEIHDYRRSQHIKLTLNEYPLRSFNIMDDAFDATAYVPMGENLHAGDSVFMLVSAEDYKNNIEQQHDPEKLLPVDVYDLHSKRQVFLTLAGYCKEVDSNGKAGVVCLVMAGAVVLAFYFHIRQRKKQKMQGVE